MSSSSSSPTTTTEPAAHTLTRSRAHVERPSSYALMPLDRPMPSGSLGGIGGISGGMLDVVIATASGKYVPKAVALGQDDFLPWKRGVSL